MEKIAFSWSSGKDAALALYQAQHEFDISLLMTAVNEHHQRVSMHGLPIDVLDRQTEALGIPLRKIYLPENPTMLEYEEIMQKQYANLAKEGIQKIAYGDIFLEDLKQYRDLKMEEHGLVGHYPIWKKDSTALLKEFIKNGFKAVVICIDSSKLDESFLGRELDDQFLAELPSSVDPCGENGEFHTFCYDGPIFEQSVQFEIGKKVFKEYKNPDGSSIGKGFWFLELL